MTTTPTDKIIASNIVYARKLKGVSQIELARHLGITCAELNTYETAAANIEGDLLSEAAQHLDQPLDWFMVSQNTDFFTSVRVLEQPL